MNILFQHLQKIDVPGLVDAVTDRWFNQTLCQVNGCVVRLGVMQGEYHWHKHDNDDEFFFCLDGEFLVDLEDRTVAGPVDVGVTGLLYHRPGDAGIWPGRRIRRCRSTSRASAGTSPSGLAGL
jgi:hypothetical protein